MEEVQKLKLAHSNDLFFAFFRVEYFAAEHVYSIGFFFSFFFLFFVCEGSAATAVGNHDVDNRRNTKKTFVWVEEDDYSMKPAAGSLYSLIKTLCYNVASLHKPSSQKHLATAVPPHCVHSQSRNPFISDFRRTNAHSLLPRVPSISEPPSPWSAQETRSHVSDAPQRFLLPARHLSFPGLSHKIPGMSMPMHLIPRDTFIWQESLTKLSA